MRFFVFALLYWISGQLIQSLLLDPSITSVRIVLNPEKMVIAEARRAFTCLNLYGLNTDAIILNRVLPEEAGVGYWSEWRERQVRYEEEIRHSFQPIPLLRVPLMRQEVIGLDALSQLAGLAFGEKNPAEFFYLGKVEEMKKEADGYVLYLTLPFIEKEDLQLTQRADELTVQVGHIGEKCCCPVP